MCLDVQGNAGARGDNVLLWSCDGGADQLWSFEPWSGPSPRRVTAPPRRIVDPPPVVDPMQDPPPPGPPPVAMRPLGGEEQRALLKAIADQGFSKDKLLVIEQAAATRWFRVAQLREIIEQLSFSADKLRALELVAPAARRRAQQLRRSTTPFPSAATRRRRARSCGATATDRRVCPG